MREMNRREFLNAAAGAAVGATVVAHTSLLRADDLSLRGRSEGAEATAPGKAAIFPRPQEMALSDGHFLVDNQVRVLADGDASGDRVALDRFLVHELSDRFNVHPRMGEAGSGGAAERRIVIGTVESAAVQRALTQAGWTSRAERLGPEGYLLHVEKDQVLIAGADERGAFYGLQSLRQLLFETDQGVFIHGAHIRDWPEKPFRGLYLYLPGRENFSFFKRFVRDYMALYKYNTLIMEMGASMRLDRHPELNAGWVQFARDCNYSCRNYPPGPFHDVEQNSSHQDTADGEILEKDEVAGLARWAAKHHIEVVPEIASFTHSYYLLTQYRKFAAVPQDKWPDIYCPSRAEVYPLVYDVYDEYIDLLKPRMVHIGHDELFLPLGASPQCSDADIGELYGEDVRKIHDHLASRGVATALWGDMLLQSVRGRAPRRHRAPDGWRYSTPGGLTPEQVERLVPKDCLIFNWFWAQDPGEPGGDALLNEATLDRMGFRQIYGNFEPSIRDYASRSQRKTLLGGAPSAWFATREAGFGKELMATFLGCSSILWSGEVLAHDDLQNTVQSMLPEIRPRLRGTMPPSATESAIVPLDIADSFNSAEAPPDGGMGAAQAGSLRFRRIPFELKVRGGMHGIAVGTSGVRPAQRPTAVTGIRIGLAPTSLIFLHACARPAANRESFRLLWDQADTADLLGWYEVVYEDGFVTTIPIRYGLNILDWNRQAGAFTEVFNQRWYCYGADAVAGGTSGQAATFYVYEWINPRLGKVIREIHLKGTTGFRGASEEYSNAWGPVIEENAVILKAISAVQKRG